MKKENIEEEKKKKVISEFINTRKQIKIIARENNLSLEQVYDILEEYNKTNVLKRPGNIIFLPTQKDGEVEDLYKKIYDLRKQKKTYKIISEETGISICTIRKICEEVFGEKGEKIPKAPWKSIQTEESKKLDEMIYNLVQQGKSCREVKEELENKGISMSIERVRQRKERKKLQNQEELAKGILNLMITRKATLEQIQKIADYYGVNLEKTMNSLEK